MESNICTLLSEVRDWKYQQTRWIDRTKMTPPYLCGNSIWKSPNYVIMSLGLAVCPFQNPPVILLWNKRRKRTLKVINLFNSPDRASHASADNTAVSEIGPRRRGMPLGCFTEADLWNTYISDKQTIPRSCVPPLESPSVGCQSLSVLWGAAQSHFIIKLLILIKISHLHRFHSCGVLYITMEQYLCRGPILCAVITHCSRPCQTT